ncbi:hypothetical protein D6777_04810 [Candidatus Woesearchaeota archaeon]|nr:MAG: hypothetical protein D6777_04810 [Candidatus Woesearchaeota archaeon]
MNIAHFFYEIEIKSLVKYPQFKKLELILDKEFELLYTQTATTQILTPGSVVFKFNDKGDYSFLIKDYGDRIIKRVNETKIDEQNYKRFLKANLDKGKKVCMKWQAKQRVYKTEICGDEYKLMLQNITNLGYMLNVLHKRKYLDDVSKHAFRIRRLIVSFGLEAITPSRFRDAIVEYKKIRYTY